MEEAGTPLSLLSSTSFKEKGFRRLAIVQNTAGDVMIKNVNPLAKLRAKVHCFQALLDIIRSRARWYEHGEKGNKYFLNLEKLNRKRKHISSLINSSGIRINDPKEILNEERNFFKQLYSSVNKGVIFFKKLSWYFNREVKHEHLDLSTVLIR